MQVFLTNRTDFDKAYRLILAFMQQNGVVTRRQMSNFRSWGIPYEAVELAVRKLRADGVIEELYTLPTARRNHGQRSTYYALTTALDAGNVELPSGVLRESKALKLIEEL